VPVLSDQRGPDEGARDVDCTPRSFGVREQLKAGKFTDILHSLTPVLATVSRHREVMGLPSMAPAISDTCFVAPSANIIGNVKVFAFGAYHTLFPRLHSD